VAASLALLFTSTDQFSPLRVAIDFSMGIVVYLERDRLTAVFARLPRFVSTILGVAGLLLLTLPMYTLLEARRPQVATLVSSGGATLLMIAAIHGPRLRRFLSWRPIAALGRVSYSIYLLHFVVLALLTPLLPPRTGLAGGIGFALLVAFATCVLAPLCYRGVELPSIRAGNAACRVLARRTGGTVRAAQTP
jgi:peptidoglycan/LPS O-acetylase OafA/YrhL